MTFFKLYCEKLVLFFYYFCDSSCYLMVQSSKNQGLNAKNIADTEIQSDKTRVIMLKK